MNDNVTCLVCQSFQLKFLFNAKGHKIFSCDQCGFCQVNKQPGDEELEKLYANLHLSHTKFRDDRAALRENQSRLQLVQKFVVPGGLILDVGCATGDFLALAKQKFTVYGIDISTGAIDMARSRLPDLTDRLKALKLEQIGEEWPKFDAICLWDVIEHVRDPLSACSMLIGLLKPGGYLLMSTPDIDALTAKVLKQHWAFMIPPLHLGYFSLRSIHHLFRRLPARVVYHFNRGKWTSLVFIFYKLSQISMLFAPGVFLNWLSTTRLGHVNLYIPSNDIIYLVAQKNSNF